MSSSGHPSPSPGRAQLVVETPHIPDSEAEPGVTSKDSIINDMTQKLADQLLAEPSTTTCKPEYISINKQLEMKRQNELSQSKLVQNSTKPYEDLPQVHTSSSYNSLSNSTGGIASEILTPSVVAQSAGSQVSTDNTSAANFVGSGSQRELDIDIGELNISKGSASVSGSSTLNTQTLFTHTSNCNVLKVVNSDLTVSQEVDMLTAMSGEPTPNSLPVVADGLSDGEISSDSEVDNTDTRDVNFAVNKTRLGLQNGQRNDPFFIQHESIMNSKTTEQVAKVKATVQEICAAVAECPSPAAVPAAAEPGESRSSNSIWQIRDSYAETLRQQEQKRKQRMEIEKRYEAEYRQKHQQEIEMLEADDNRILPAMTLDDDNIEQINTGTDYYSSDEDDMMSYNGEPDGSRDWGWTSNSKYSRVGTSDGYRRAVLHPASGLSHTSSNASRLADHQLVTSPTNNRKFGRHPKFSHSSDSSSSCLTPPPTVKCKAHGRHSPGSDTDSSSTRSWDQDYLVSQQSPDQKHKVKKTTTQRSSDSKKKGNQDYDTDEETDRLLNKPYLEEGRVDLPPDTQELGNQAMKNKAKEVTVYDPDEPTVLIEGILFRAAYLGSTQLMSEAQPSKAIRMLQAQEAVGRIKAMEGESQPSTDVDLFVSIEKVMVLNTGLQEIMMDHALRSISYIADIDNILVVMAKRSLVLSSPSSGDEQSTLPSNAQQKLICHIFETDEAHLIAQSIGQAFQVAYMEFLKANGIEDPNIHLKDTSYEDILQQQEIMHDELETFTKKDRQKDVIVPKSKGEALGIVIVESGWGSMLPTVVLANMSPVGAAARCGHLNIGDQIMSVNGISLVGLPLSTCQEHVKAVKNLTAVRLCVVSRPPVVEVLIKRPDKKYQLGFSVQNGVICSLLRGGIAERGGIRVGHRIIEINGQSVVAVPHEKIVHMLSTSIGEIHMKTMPMAVFRLLTGQEVPQYI